MTPLNSPWRISSNLRRVSELLLLRRTERPSSSSPSASSSCVKSSIVFRNFSYAALSSECETSSLLYLSFRTVNCASRSRACFSLRSRNARWAARFCARRRWKELVYSLQRSSSAPKLTPEVVCVLSAGAELRTGAKTGSTCGCGRGLQYGLS